MIEPNAPRGIVLFAHGSRDPLWHAPLEAVRLRIASDHPDLSVRCAYLEWTEPDLPSAANALIEQGAQRITIVPMFLGAGRHAREDLPRLVDALRQAHASVHFHVQPAIGEDARVTGLMAQIACEAPSSESPRI